MEYNLLYEKWIPVLYRDGRWERVGILKAFEEASEIRQIAATNPMDRLAIMRFLIALVYWCEGSVASGGEHPASESLLAEVASFLKNRRQHFQLLGDEKRFYQYRKPDDKFLTANYLMHEVPTGTNKWHFRHATEEEDGLCPACCALGLLRLPVFATSGGRGKPPGINAKPPMYAVPIGRSLAGTLLQARMPVEGLGTAAWEDPAMTLPVTGRVPLLTGMTWLPRRVWLADPGDPVAPCISCGTICALVRHAVFGAIGSTKTDDDVPGRLWDDPHVLQVKSRKGEVAPVHAADALGAADAAVGQWARIAAGLLQQYGTENAGPHSSDEKAQTRDLAGIWLVGFSTVQNDKYLEAMDLTVPLPLNTDSVSSCLERIERWQKGTWKLNGRLGHSRLMGPSLLSTIRPHVEHGVSADLKSLLAGDDDQWDQNALLYRPMMRVIARSLAPRATVTDLSWRWRLSGLTPDVRPKKGKDKTGAEEDRNDRN